jgi:hypothetical protein
MLALLTLFKLVGRSYAYASGFYGGMTMVPLPVPPYLPKPLNQPDLPRRVSVQPSE